MESVNEGVEQQVLEEEAENPSQEAVSIRIAPEVASRKSNIESTARVLLPLLFIIYNICFFLFYSSNNDDDYDKLCSLHN